MRSKGLWKHVTRHSEMMVLPVLQNLSVIFNRKIYRVFIDVMIQNRRENGNYTWKSERLESFNLKIKCKRLCIKNLNNEKVNVKCHYPLFKNLDNFYQPKPDIRSLP